ncbi:MAG: iron-sulfur cluster assembly scaffold protein, partial [Gemmatimonadales bacterium]
MIDRETRLAWIVDHYNRPRHKAAMADADAAVPGGNPGCGDIITMYLKDGAVSWEGVGCTLSQASASILADRVNKDHPSFEEILAMTPESWMDLL